MSQTSSEIVPLFSGACVEMAHSAIDGTFNGCELNGDGFAAIQPVFVIVARIMPGIGEPFFYKSDVRPHTCY